MICGDWAFPVVPWWYPLIGRPVGGPPRDIRIVSELAEYGAAVSINRLPKAGDCVAVVFLVRHADRKQEISPDEIAHCWALAYN